MRRGNAISALLLAMALMPAAGAQAPVRRTVLPNGVRVLVRPEPGTGLVACSVFVRAGSAEEGNRPGVAALVARALFGESVNLSRDAASREIAFAGGAMEAHWDADYTRLSCLTTEAVFEDAFYVLAQGLKHALFDPVTVKRAREEVAAEARRRASDLVEAAVDAALPALYAQSAYRTPPGGAPEGVARLTPADAAAFHRRAYVPNRTVVVVAGDIDPARALRVVEGQLLYEFDRPGPRALPYPPAPEPPLASSRVEAAGPPGAALVMAAFRAPAVTDADYPAARVLAALLGGGKGSRLFKALRQEAGLGYAVGARLEHRAGEAPLLAWAQVDPTRPSPGSERLDLADLERRLLDVARSVMADPPNERELERARRYAVGTHVLAHERVADRAFHLGFFEVLGAGHAFDDALPGRLQAVTAADVQRAAQRCLRRQVLVRLAPAG